MENIIYDWRKGREVKRGILSQFLACNNSTSRIVTPTEDERKWWSTKYDVVLKRKQDIERNGFNGVTRYGLGYAQILAHLSDPEIGPLYLIDLEARRRIMNMRGLMGVSPYLLEHPATTEKGLSSIMERTSFLENWAKKISTGQFPTPQEMSTEIDFCRIGLDNKPYIKKQEVGNALWHDIIQHSCITALPYIYKLSLGEATQAYNAFYNEMVKPNPKAKSEIDSLPLLGPREIHIK